MRNLVTSSDPRSGLLQLLAVNAMTLPEAALYYRRSGFAIVPTRLNPKGKHVPYHKDWQALRLTEMQVQEHWQKRPNDGIGLRLGINDAGFQHVHAIDLDTRPDQGKDGIKSFKELCPDVREWITSAPYALTPSNGVHILVQPALTAQAINHGAHGGIDLLTTGIIVVSPTTRPDGRYMWKQDGAPISPPRAILTPPIAGKAGGTAASRSASQPPVIYTLRDVDLTLLPIATDLKEAISSGDASQRHEGDRSALIGEVAFKLYVQGIDRDTSLSLLTDPRFGISAKALDERRNNRQAAARWIAEYQWRQAVEKVGTERFRPFSELTRNRIRPARIPFPLAALPKVLREFSVEIAKAVGIAPELVATPGLAVLSALVASRFDVLPQSNKPSWRVRPNLWSLSISPPGTGKSPATNAVLSPIKRREDQLWREYTAAKDFHQLTQKAEARKRDRRRRGRTSVTDINSPGGGQEISSDELQPPVPAPIRQRLWIGDTTVEALQQALSENQDRVLIVHRDEVMGLITKLSDDHYASDRAFLLSSFDGVTAEAVDRISRQAIYLAEPATSIIGNATPTVLLKNLADWSRQDGLQQRFQLLAFPEPDFRETSIEPENGAVIEQWQSTVTELANLALSPRITRPEEAFGSRTGTRTVLSFDPAAQVAFGVMREKIRRATHDLRESEGIAGHLGKLPAFLASVAAILHVLDCHPNTASAIPLATLDRADKLVAFYRDQAERLYEAGAVPFELAQAVLAALPQLTRTFSVREAYRSVRALKSNKEVTEQVLDFLADHGYLRRLEAKTDGRGRKPSPYYTVHPVIVERMQIPERNGAADDFADLVPE